MKHRIVVLGAGYAVAYTAGTPARRLFPAGVEITVVNAVPDFVRRLRLHQLPAGREIAAPRLADVFAGGDRIAGAVTFDLTGGRIATVRGIAAPGRLARLTGAWRRRAPDAPLIARW